jgi:hypothetical protein
MRASIIVSTALSLLWTTSSALAQETPGPVTSATPIATTGATASASKSPAERPHRLLFGASVGGGSYGGDGTALVGLDATYAYRIATGADFGFTGTLSPGQMFAGAFGDLAGVELSRNVSWRVGAELGVHRIAHRYATFNLFSESYEILTAPHGVFLPYAGAKMSFDRTGRSGAAWGVQLLVRQDLMRQRHMVLVTDGGLWGGSEDTEEQDIGGRTVMLGFYIGRAM